MLPAWVPPTAGWAPITHISHTSKPGGREAACCMRFPAAWRLGGRFHSRPRRQAPWARTEGGSPTPGPGTVRAGPAPPQALASCVPRPPPHWTEAPGSWTWCGQHFPPTCCHLDAGSPSTGSPEPRTECSRGPSPGLCLAPCCRLPLGFRVNTPPPPSVTLPCARGALPFRWLPAQASPFSWFS